MGGSCKGPGARSKERVPGTVGAAVCRRQPKQGAGSTTAAVLEGRSRGRLQPREAEAPRQNGRPHNVESSLPPLSLSCSASVAAAAAKTRIVELPIALSRASPDRDPQWLFGDWGVRAGACESPGHPRREQKKGARKRRKLKDRGRKEGKRERKNLVCGYNPRR